MNLYPKGTKAIIVKKDPRDLYLFHKYVLKNLGCFVPVDGIENYIQYIKYMYKDIENYRKNENILLIDFEDLLFKYDQTTEVINKFLGISYKSQKKYFDPKISIVNAKLFDRFRDTNTDIIEQSLEEYLYHFDCFM